MNAMFALSHMYRMVYSSRYHQATLHIIRNNFWNPVTILVGWLCPGHCKYLVWWVFIFNNSGCWALSMVITQWCLIWVCRKTNETQFSFSCTNCYILDFVKFLVYLLTYVIVLSVFSCICIKTIVDIAQVSVIWSLFFNFL